jgi:4'-phosphopantetheinyl transferase
MISGFQPGGAVHLWSTAISALEDPEQTAAAWAVLSTSEKQQAGRFHFQRGQNAFLASRSLRRRALSHYAAVDPGVWQFAVNEHGQPRIASPVLDETLEFSCSKSVDVVICAVTRGISVGVDIERVDRRVPEGMAEAIFAPSERAALAALPQQEQGKRFFTYWTLKEAYLKARGLGLSLPLDPPAFSVADSPRREGNLAFSVANDYGEWHFTLLAPSPSHIAAVCVRGHAGPARQVVMRHLSPPKNSLMRGPRSS